MNMISKPLVFPLISKNKIKRNLFVVIEKQYVQ